MSIATPAAIASLVAGSRAAHLALPKYRPDIDGLRALAVLAVVGFHAFPDWVIGGFVGVDVFFVISGYLITTIIVTNLARERFSFAEFYARRIRRIFPALTLVLLASLALGWFALFAGELEQLGKHVAGGAGFISNFLLWREAGYFDDAADTKPLLHLWSLGVEEQFYLVWPPLLWLLWKRRAAVFAVTAAIAALSFVLCLWQVGASPSAAFYLPATRLWELLLGAMLVPGIRADGGAARASWWPSADFRAAVGLLMVGIGFFATTRETPFPGAWTLFPTLGTCLLISAGSAWLNRTVLANRALVAIGLISFPLYLWHWPLLSFSHIVEGGTPPPLARIAAVLASAALAWLTYRLIERPIRFGGSPKAVPALIGMMLFAGYAGYECFRHAGLPSRPAALSSAINRFDRPYQQSCLPLTKAKSRNDWCNAGNDASSSPAIVVIGDSFANAYSPMLAKLLGDTHAPGLPAFRQFGRQQCPMLVGYGPPFCREITEQALAFIRDTKSVRLVVLASNWSLYQTDFDWGGYAEKPETFNFALETTIRTLRRAGKDLAVFLAPPVGSWPKACVVRPLRLTGEDRCALSLRFARAREGDYRERLLPRLKALSIPYFDPFPYLCGASTCKVTDGRLILSTDGYHLSVHGGEFLAREARSELLQVLRIAEP